MKRFVEGIDRRQSTMFPEQLDDWVRGDNPVRVVDVFVEALDPPGYAVPVLTLEMHEFAAVERLNILTHTETQSVDDDPELPGEVAFFPVEIEHRERIPRPRVVKYSVVMQPQAHGVIETDAAG